MGEADAEVTRESHIACALLTRPSRGGPPRASARTHSPVSSLLCSPTPSPFLSYTSMRPGFSRTISLPPPALPWGPHPGRCVLGSAAEASASLSLTLQPKKFSESGTRLSNLHPLPPKSSVRPKSIYALKCFLLEAFSNRPFFQNSSSLYLLFPYSISLSGKLKQKNEKQIPNSLVCGPEQIS